MDLRGFYIHKPKRATPAELSQEEREHLKLPEGSEVLKFDVLIEREEEPPDFEVLRGRPKRQLKREAFSNISKIKVSVKVPKTFKKEIEINDVIPKVLKACKGTLVDEVVLNLGYSSGPFKATVKAGKIFAGKEIIEVFGSAIHPKAHWWHKPVFTNGVCVLCRMYLVFRLIEVKPEMYGYIEIKVKDRKSRIIRTTKYKKIEFKF